MPNLELLNKIKAEIERLKNRNAEWRERIDSEDGYSYESDVCCGYEEAIEDFETFINSLSEEKPSEDLEKAAEKYALLFEDGTKWKDGGKYKGFIAGAKWQKNQMPKDSEEDVLLLERAWLTLDNLGHKELAERLKTFKEKYANKV